MTTASQQPRLYTDLAWLWPLLSPPEHYVEEAECLLALFAEHQAHKVAAAATASRPRASAPISPSAKHQPPRLLELGAGSGHLLYHLQDSFECTGVDLSGAMLQQLSKLVPTAHTRQGDMRTLRLEQPFDVVLIADAIDYMRTEEDVRQALHTAHTHLRPGGLLWLAPTYLRDHFEDGETAEASDSTADTEVTYFSYVHTDSPSRDRYELILLYLLRDKQTHQVQLVEDRHSCGLFSEEQWLAWLSEAGFHAQPIEDDKAWALFQAVKKS